MLRYRTIALSLLPWAIAACAGGPIEYGSGDTDPGGGDQDNIAGDTSVAGDAPSPGDDSAAGDDGPPPCGSAVPGLPGGLTELAWDDGVPLSHLGEQSLSITVSDTYYLAEEELFEAVRFELEHPARIHGFAIQWGGLPVGGDPELELEAGLYRDFGHNGFDFWRPLPYWRGTRCLADAEAGGWLEYGLPNPIDISQPGLVYVAHLRPGPDEPAFLFGAGNDDCAAWSDCHSACNLPNAETALYYDGLSFSLQYNYMVRLYVEYLDDLPAEERIFQAVPDLPLNARVAFGDYDHDGWDDILTNGPTLWHNDGDGTFTDVTATALPAVSGSGGVWGDYDNDGCLDLFVFSESMTGADSLLHSLCDGTFEDVTAAAGIVDLQSYNDCGDPANIRSPSAAAAWLDIDADGLLDLYVPNFICWGTGLSYVDTVFHNDDGAVFSEWTADHGFSDAALASRGAAPIDHDDDGDVDLLVNNYRLHRNHFFDNNGDGTVTETAVSAGLAGISTWMSPTLSYYGHTIGTAWGDIDNDDDFDVIQANLAHPRFFHFSNKTQILINDGGSYTDIAGSWVMPASPTGLRYQETHSSPLLADFDQDGNLDMVITAVYPGRPTDFYWGNGDGTFELDVYAAGITTVNGWGAAASDIDHDGDPDLAAYSLFENRFSDGGHWLQVRVVGNVAANWAAIGATVIVETGSERLRRHVQGGSGQGCQDSLSLHFGLGVVDSVDRILVHFPGGGEVIFDGPFGVDQRLWLYEDGNSHAGWSPL